LIGENGVLRQKMKQINDKITELINRELKDEFKTERAKSRAGKQSLPNINSMKQEKQPSPIATARHKFLLKKASL
jgi:hypothetical protein